MCFWNVVFAVAGSVGVHWRTPTSTCIYWMEVSRHGSMSHVESSLGRLDIHDLRRHFDVFLGAAGVYHVLLPHAVGLR